MSRNQDNERLQQLLYGRREFLIVAGGALASAGIVGLVGCGGGSSTSGSGTTYPLMGRVALPKGVATPPTSLSIVSGVSITTPTATGQFTVRGFTSEPSLTLATDTNGNGILLGFADPQSSANTLNETSSAIALLYFAIGGPSAPIANKRQILSLLATHSATSPLASVIASRLVANPLALQNGDSQIAAALQTALAALSPNVGTVDAQVNSDRVADTTPTGRRTRAAAALQEQVQPSGQQSGMEVLQPDSEVGVFATNHYRRRATMYIYRVGEVATDGTVKHYATAVAVGNPISIDPTTALGLFSTLGNLFSGTTAFVPVSTAVQPLALQPDTTQTNFEVVILGASAGATPAFFSDARYAAVSPGWISAQQDLNLYTAIGDIALGFILELWGLRVLASSAAITAFVGGVKAIQLPTMATLLAKARAGAYPQTIGDLIELVADSDIVSAQVKAALRPYILQLEREAVTAAGQTVSQKLLGSAFRLISATFLPVSLTLGAGDLAAIAHDLANSNPGDLWTVALVQPTLTLDPSIATIEAGGRVTFTVKPPPGTTGNVEYDWTQSSTFDTLSASDGAVGNAIKTASSSVTVDLVTTSSDTGTVTVTVIGYSIAANGVKTKFGQTQAKVTLNARTESTNVLVVCILDGNGNFLAQGFYTFAPVSDANAYVIGTPGDSAILTQAQYAAGAPVISPNSNTVPWVPYAASTEFFNVGGGLIGYLAVPFYPTTGYTPLSMKPQVVAALTTAMQSTPMTVTIR